MYVILDVIETRKLVPKLRGPALVCLSAIDKKNQCIGLPHGPEF